MLRHVVMWRFKDNAEGKTKKENCQWVKEHLEALPEIIPQIKSMEIGINELESDMAFDMVLIMTFNNFDDLNIYKNHPKHVVVSSYVKKIKETRNSVDFNF